MTTNQRCRMRKHLARRVYKVLRDAGNDSFSADDALWSLNDIYTKMRNPDSPSGDYCADIGEFPHEARHFIREFFAVVGQKEAARYAQEVD